MLCNFQHPPLTPIHKVIFIFPQTPEKVLSLLFPDAPGSESHLHFFPRLSVNYVQLHHALLGEGVEGGGVDLPPHINVHRGGEPGGGGNYRDPIAHPGLPLDMRDGGHEGLDDEQLHTGLHDGEDHTGCIAYMTSPPVLTAIG